MCKMLGKQVDSGMQAAYFYVLSATEKHLSKSFYPTHLLTSI